MKTTPAEEVLDVPQDSVLDMLDHLLNKGVMLTGDVTLGVAGVDLIYVRLGALLAAADRVLPVVDDRPRRARRNATRRIRRRRG